VSKPKYSNYSNNECIEEVFFTNQDQLPSKARSEKNIIRIPEKPEIKPPTNQKVNVSKKMESLENLKNPKFLESCCFSNKPQTTSTDPNMASCVHYIRGKFATLTDKLKQFKSKWYQECKIQSLANKTLLMEAYIGDSPICQLLGYSVPEVKEKFLKKNNTSNESFEQCKRQFEDALENSTCLMHLKYNFEKNLFCVYQIEDVQI